MKNDAMKKVFFTDAEIDALVREPKFSGHSVDSILRSMSAKTGKEKLHMQTSITFARSNGTDKWLIYLRSSTKKPLDFSCGIEFISARMQAKLTIRRYNGKSHEHTNKLENMDPFYDFHIHQATERYQRSHHDDDTFAMPTNLYVDFPGAFKTLLSECHVVVTADKQENVFS